MLCNACYDSVLFENNRYESASRISSLGGPGVCVVFANLCSRASCKEEEEEEIIGVWNLPIVVGKKANAQIPGSCLLSWVLPSQPLLPDLHPVLQPLPRRPRRAQPTLAGDVGSERATAWERWRTEKRLLPDATRMKPHPSGRRIRMARTFSPHREGTPIFLFVGSVPGCRV